MAAIPPTATTYEELYSDPANNPFRKEEELVDLCYSEVNKFWRATHSPLTVEALHQNIHADFSRPIGALGVFVYDDESGTGRLKLKHGLHIFPGTPGYSRDRMVTMACEGDVAGIDVCTIAFDAAQLEVTPDVVVPSTLDRVQQLLNEEPGCDVLGPFKSLDVNVRTTKTRGMGYFPFPVPAPLLGMDLTARQVFELIVPVLIEAGLQDVCSGLINFLTVALVLPAEDSEVPVTVWAQARACSHQLQAHPYVIPRLAFPVPQYRITFQHK
jgi:hypothetical protein